MLDRHWFQFARAFFRKFLQTSGFLVEVRPTKHLSTSPSFFKFNSHRNFTHQHEKKDPIPFNPSVKQFEVATQDFVDLLDTRIEEWIREVFRLGKIDHTREKKKKQ